MSRPTQIRLSKSLIDGCSPSLVFDPLRERGLWGALPVASWNLRMCPRLRRLTRFHKFPSLCQALAQRVAKQRGPSRFFHGYASFRGQNVVLEFDIKLCRVSCTKRRPRQLNRAATQLLTQHLSSLIRELQKHRTATANQSGYNGVLQYIGNILVFTQSMVFETVLTSNLTLSVSLKVA